jgi:hypothetical protein
VSVLFFPKQGVSFFTPLGFGSDLEESTEDSVRGRSLRGFGETCVGENEIV